MKQKKIKKAIIIVFIIFFLLNFFSPLIKGLFILATANISTETTSKSSSQSGTTKNNTNSASKPVSKPTVDKIDYKNYSYYFTKYDVTIDVDENRVFYITEKINAYFNKPKHGIIRDIPIKATLYRDDNTKSFMRAKIKDINVNAQHTITGRSNYKSIKIGDPNTTITGPKTYIINYTYDMGNDPLKDVDEFYFNIIGTEFDTAIANATFTINMPKDFDAENLGFSTGKAGNVGYSNLEYEVNGRTITGHTTAALNPFEGITVRLTVPEDYFIEEVNPFDFIYRIIPLCCILVGLFIWIIWGKDSKYVAPISFYPPNNYNSAELGMLYKGRAGNEEVISLLIYMANKGYWDIENIEQNALFLKNNTFKIIFKKENYEGNNSIERTFFKGLYKLAAYDEKTGTKYVNEGHLVNRFYITSNKIIKDLNSKTNIDRIFEKKKIVPYAILILSMAMCFFIGFIIPTYEYNNDLTVAILTNLFPAIAVIVFTSLFKPKGGTLITNVFAIVWSLGFGGIPFLIGVLPPIIVMGRLSISLTCIAAFIILMVILRYMPKRTELGTKLLGEIEGFKTFLKTAEKSRLETLVYDDPDYFYNILPYTYVLDVSDKWIEQFEDIVFDAPKWYHGAGTFSAVALSGFMTNTLFSASSSMTSSPSSSSGGSGSSGGSSSGGGGGGGGGSSWEVKNTYLHEETFALHRRS